MRSSAAGGAQGFAAIRIEKSSPVPVYAQIAESMRTLLRSGTIPAGTALPPERALCEQFGISRMTLRQAYEALEREGLIESHRGRGTFVAPQRLQKKQQEMRSFTEEIRSRGATPSSRLLTCHTVKQTSRDRDFFNLAQGEQLYEIERLRLADNVPVAVELIHIPQYLCPHLDRFNLAAQSIYSILEENYGVALTHCTEQISAARPTRTQKQLLEVPTGEAVLTVDRRTFGDNETPVELATTTYRGDLYTAVVHSVRSKSA